MGGAVDVVINEGGVEHLGDFLAVTGLHEVDQLEEVLVVDVREQLQGLWGAGVPVDGKGAVVAVAWLVKLSPVIMNMTKRKNDIENHIKRNLTERRVIPLLHQTNDNLLQLREISHNSLGMVLVQTLDDFCVPLDVAFVLGKKGLLDVLEEEV